MAATKVYGLSDKGLKFIINILNYKKFLVVAVFISIEFFTRRDL